MLGLGFWVSGLGFRAQGLGSGQYFAWTLQVSSAGGTEKGSEESCNSVATLILTHRPLSSSFFGVIIGILYGNPKKELLRGLWVGAKYPSPKQREALQNRSSSCGSRKKSSGSSFLKLPRE